MAPRQGEKTVSDNVGMTRIKFALPVDPSSAPIPVQFDQVTPALVMESIPDTATILATQLFRDVAAFLGRYFASQETKYLEKIALNGATYTKSVYYFASSYENELAFAMLHTWWWLLDDFVDTCGLKGTTEKMEMLDILDKFIGTGGNPEETIKTNSDPWLRAMLESYAEWDATMGGIVPDYFSFKDRFTKGLKVYLQSSEWGLIDSTLTGYSFEMFSHWRNISCGAIGSNELMMLLEDGNPPKYMLDHVMVKTLFYTSSTLGAVRNDIVGVVKDLAKNETGGTVMHKILVEEKSPDAAVQEIISLHEKVIRDYVQLRKAILNLFKNCGQDDFKKLENCFELLERYEYGATIFYFASPRYLLDGKFELEHITTN